MREVTTLFELATNVFVRHTNLLWAYLEMIPAVIYDSLLMASLRTDRILSTRCLFSTWPLQELSLIGCKEIFTQQHALTLAHCLESGCHRLQEVDLTGCNIGVHGTTCFLKLVVGAYLPNVTKYSTNEERTRTSASDKKRLQGRLSITTDCYVSFQNYPLFLDVLNGHSHMLHDFIVSYFYAIELGPNRITNITKKLGNFHAQSIIGLNFEMNSLPRNIVEDKTLCYKSWNNFSNLRHLNLSMNLIGLHAIYIILKHITASLTHLLLNSCGILADGSLYFSQISELCCIRKLERLELENNRLRQIVPGMMKFLENCSGTLKILNLKYNGLTDESAPRILQMLHAPFTLKTLHIGENRLSFDAMRMLLGEDDSCCIEGYKCSRV